MAIGKMQSIEKLIKSWGSSGITTESTKKLTKFFARARFGVTGEAFEKQFVDGLNDGGIDFFHQEDNIYYIVQTKYSENSKLQSSSEIIKELKKIEKTISEHNPNKKAEAFVNHLRRELENSNAMLEVIWLTTNNIHQDEVAEMTLELNRWKIGHKLQLDTDFVAYDKAALENINFSIHHGFVPHTGKNIAIKQRSLY